MQIAPCTYQDVTQAIAPVHTMVDGDLVFAHTLVSEMADLHRVGFTAADLLAGPSTGLSHWPRVVDIAPAMPRSQG
jgi:hypothetical protein